MGTVSGRLAPSGCFDRCGDIYYLLERSTNTLLRVRTDRGVPEEHVDHTQGKFVPAFTKLVLHLGHLATSCAEGKHSSIKGWISISSGDLKDVYEKISLSIDYQEHHICQQIIYNNTHSILAFSHIIWKDVKRKISHYALYKVYEKFQKAKHLAGDSTCSSIF